MVRRWSVIQTDREKCMSGLFRSVKAISVSYNSNAYITDKAEKSSYRYVYVLPWYSTIHNTYYTKRQNG